MEPNIKLLLKEGVTASSIETLLLWKPITLMQKIDRVVYVIQTVKKLGFYPSAPLYVQAIRVLLSMSDSTCNRKLQIFKSLGWSEEETWSAFKQYSICLALSEEKIRKTMDFYVNTMKLDPKVIVAHPNLLSYALNTIIRPRYNVINVLESRKVLKEGKKLFWMFLLTEKDFLEKYVDKHFDQISNLLEVYRGAIACDEIEFQLQ